MSDLIKITTKDGRQLVSARELHEFLEIKTDFRKWFPRMCEYGFEESIDYTPVKFVHPMNLQECTDYAISIDMAKELSMIQRTEKGKQARLYFIECEKKLKEVDVKANLLLSIYNGGQEGVTAAKKLTELEVEEATKPLLPKAEFYDAVTDSKDAIPMSSVAKVLNIKGIGRNKLFEILRDKNILRGNNEPYQTMVDRGYFRVIETKYTKNGDTHINLKTLVTQKGLDYIRKILNKQK